MAEMERPADTVETCLREAYKYLKDGNPFEARQVLEKALSINFEHPEVLYALKCLNWWLGICGMADKSEGSYDRGMGILAQWKNYYLFLAKIGATYDMCQYAIRHFVFSTALQALLEVEGDGELRHDPELLLNLGRCYKGIGNYETAAEYLRAAAGYKREDAAALAEFADVNALLGDITTAKGLFREAFYINPQAVDIEAMECELIQKLAAHTRGAGKTGAALNEWMPVYGALTGVFSVARALNQLEVSRLKQSIKDLENDLSSSPKNEHGLLPRLLNRYLRLMKHYEVHNFPEGIQEIILKMRIYDAELYERYIK
ncbi:MAG: hypothetical protein LBG74_06125 [Spirochaetaceae bacterium]|jgi:tetratricopeptide (TPR) repeat protein|nr:hypothetical protein [Spirochaetaceae bacterium]